MESTRSINTHYRGRFAPSPTGPLHFGSLVAAVGSYADAKFHGGKWLVRIEDVDLQRRVPGAAKQILDTLEKLGMEWDEEIIYQSQRSEAYRDALHVLNKQGLLYPCTCSRKEIADSSITGLYGFIYPGTCLNNPASLQNTHALRIQTHDDVIQFTDGLKGLYTQKLRSEVGDFVLRRADGIYAYQLAVVVDDATQNITHVVRGADLIDSTPRQIFLQQLLRYPVPQYMHLPVVTNAAGEKLSKQTNAAPVNTAEALKELVDALHFLGQQPPLEILEGDIASFWRWVKQNWRVNRIPNGVM
ncbi:tRNA glutamyl-Q(34) synthetase GluQRS [Nitrosomonas sp. Is35]|uniref:tRNA glutamyl-Q(34) synthetase GluQRS n=1 Tax=unclassified Nitrosomonas TaxID=2609265 RepID=UPI00294AC0DA|nr:MULTISPECIES: tRNA glutamyl-Q(34) synthetase GluQRS [unclassified Nitrosomonas]MDV6341745.1 tRNA glutamyl-Q(34) synthetase GluQRS [Nitrosomonas sp. Is24]MDV6347013.1 tRNA glutamyl-Q(34) synthetase GluQRS [Nitrosomonas sp. Is35]